MKMTYCKVHKLVADVTLLTKGRVLLVTYKETSKYDYQSGWFLPDDYLQHVEHPEKAAKRILKEQLDLTVRDVSLAFIESFDDSAWHLIFHYKSVVSTVPKVSSGENVKEARWFSLRELPERSEVAHEGWGLDVLSRISKLRV